MKNIHVLPTDKPSRLSIIDSQLIYSKEYFINAQNIYITSNEVIKEWVNQWYLDKYLNKPYNSGGAQYSPKQDVIILTTDQDLIKDGVQAIDDEFLEWFVKNPSCEEVDVANSLVRTSSFDWRTDYKIIIPKEEPKQETLEEFINSQPYYGSCTTEYLEGIEIGAKWQQEQNKNKFSEEELYKLTLESLDLGMKIRQDQLNGYSEKSGKELHKEWFEQFKNK
jgi:hypothetical protein